MKLATLMAFRHELLLDTFGTVNCDKLSPHSLRRARVDHDLDATTVQVLRSGLR
jgi:hypothetical protein